MYVKKDLQIDLYRLEIIFLLSRTGLFLYLQPLRKVNKGVLLSAVS